VQVASPGVLDSIGQHTGTLINAAAFIVVVFLIAFFGLRPMAAALTQSGAPALPTFAGPSFEEMQRALPNAEGMASFEEEPVALSDQRSHAMDDLRNKLRPAPQDRLARMVDINEERTALILRKWAGQEVAA
jgi:flagellar M-ring protein FliF